MLLAPEYWSYSELFNYLGNLGCLDRGAAVGSPHNCHRQLWDSEADRPVQTFFPLYSIMPSRVHPNEAGLVNPPSYCYDLTLTT
ncbi:hypothetical protein IF1G_07235 [Cordyceps javanica]|uniref:Uncharacterized protein n=1 Tax=Cordyceps javanica TaxID=43265 RepID=A0A545UY31_9HYPO|nr:hypothetical protein IF1G_07235 [Cordyceps javanica]